MRIFSVVAVSICLALSACGNKEKTQAEKDRDIAIGMQILAKKFVLGALKDPDSASLRSQNGPCGEVNSKNSFGGMVGHQRFVAASDKIVILERDSSLPSAEFQQLWDTACKYRPK